MLVATATCLALIRFLHVDAISAILMGAVLIVAVTSGLVLGLVAAAGALAAFHLMMGGLLLPHGLWSFQGMMLAMFAGGVVLTGVNTDITRRRNVAARMLIETNKAWAPQWREVVREKTEPVRPAAPVVSEELKRLGVVILIIGVAWAAGQVARGMLTPATNMLLFLGAVLLVGGLMGARLGLAAAILAVVVMTAAPSGAELGPAELAISALVMAATGWGVGRLADRLQRERDSVEVLVAASRDLSGLADEGAVRQALLDNLSALAKGGAIQILDEAGGQAVSTPGLTPDRLKDPAGWRERDMISDGRPLGLVRWTTPEAGGGQDEVAAALIDLAAAAIARTRLGLEKSEIEFVARTEHLRTILLDAVSHHFRSPLAGILGSVTGILNLPEQHDRGARRQMLLIIKEQANRLNRYVENFLSVARLESGSIDVNLADVQLEPLIYDVWETFGEAGGSRRFLHVQVGEESVRSDPSLLTQVLGNVLENAIKFSSEGSLIDVRSRCEGDRMVLEVTDQGCGVPEGAQARLFDRFYRSNTSKAPGLGLGLYITRSLTEMLGGSVEARNRTDGESGLVMSLTLPLTRPQT